MAEKLAPEKCHSFLHNGQKEFQWDQALDEVNIYINLRLNVHPKQFYRNILSNHLQLGIKARTYLSGEDRFFFLDPRQREDDIMHITLQKRDKGHTWDSPTLSLGQLDPYSAGLEQMCLMLQRFQEENPGFDFSQAQFTGSCPDPRTFMGGIRSG